VLNAYEDIFALAERLGEKPRWFDENGVPRYCEHHPSSSADIYAVEVALVLISCQQCGVEMPVQMSHDLGDLLDRVPVSLAEAAREGTLHYGDPPAHDDGADYCHAGCTMNCWDLRVLEFWRRTGFEWERVAALEIELPGARDSDRVPRGEAP